MANTLTLVLKKQWFDLMVTGEKTMEYRKPSDWIKSRLYNKDGSVREYNFVKFILGYQRNAPYFICKYEGFGTGYNNTYNFSDGSQITPEKEDYALFLGEIVSIANIKI